jgi:adenylyltransferase/sulfurtransferase
VLPGIIGTIQTTEALKLILGIGESLAGRLLLVDALRMSFRTLNLRKDPECPACGTHEITELIDYEEFCGVRQAAAADAAAQSAVPEITPAQLAERIARGDDFDLIDVREPHEWDIARIPGARLIPLGTIIEALPTLDSARDIVVHCKVGGRSAKAVQQLQASGFRKVWNLVGGITRWSDDVDPSVPKY